MRHEKTRASYQKYKNSKFSTSLWEKESKKATFPTTKLQKAIDFLHKKKKKVKKNYKRYLLFTQKVQIKPLKTKESSHYGYSPSYFILFLFDASPHVTLRVKLPMGSKKGVSHAFVDSFSYEKRLKSHFQRIT